MTIKVDSFSCDLATIPVGAELVQAITTGFRPAIIDFLSNINGTATTSWGFADAAQSRCIFNDHLDAANTEAISVSKALYAARGGGNSAFAYVVMTATGFEVRWEKTGAPTGSFTVMYRAWDGNGGEQAPPTQTGRCLSVNRSLRATPWGKGPFVTADGANDYGNHVPATCMTAGPGTSPPGAGAVNGYVKMEVPALNELPPGCDWCRIHWDNAPTTQYVGWPSPHTDGQNIYWRLHPGATELRGKGVIWQRMRIKHNAPGNVPILTMIEDGLGPVTPNWTGATHFQYGDVLTVLPGAVQEFYIQHDLPPAEVVAGTHYADTVSYGIGLSKAALLALPFPFDIWIWSALVDKNDSEPDPTIEDDINRSNLHHRRVGGCAGIAIPNTGGQIGVVRFDIDLQPQMISAAGIFFRTGLSTGASYYRTRAGVTTQLFNSNPLAMIPQNEMSADGGSFLAANFDVLPGDIVQVANLPWQIDGA